MKLRRNDPDLNINDHKILTMANNSRGNKKFNLDYITKLQSSNRTPQKYRVIDNQYSTGAYNSPPNLNKSYIY